MPTKAPSLPGGGARVPPLHLRQSGRNSSISSGDSGLSNDRRTGSRTAQSTASAEDVETNFIKVICRVRPKLPKEKKVPDGVEVGSTNQSLMLSNAHGGSKTFTVDHVYDSREREGSQECVFRQFGQEYVNQSVSGYNVCMFAYGHTGSGKTYTMLGDRGSDAHGDLAGMIPRFLQDIFKQHANQMAEKRQYICEFFEVYNEHIKDLLVPLKSGDRTRKVHVHPKHGVSVENLTHSVVTDAEEALQLVEFGNQMRAVATTTMNARSSRSHAIFTFKYEQTCNGKNCQSTVTFVDLAGREDQAASQNQAQTFREMCCINTSLFHLANVITKLSQGTIDRRSLSDFRNSRLTLLLSHALIGNSKTALIATIAPLKSFFDDSVSTLNFAASVKKIKTRPVVNNKNPNVVVAELEKEIRRLQSDLSVSAAGEAEKERALLCAEALIAKYKRSWEEAVSKTQVYNTKRRQSLSMMGLLDLDALGTAPSSVEVAPFLTKLSNDPSLQGRCNYILNRSCLRMGSDEKACTLVLQGLGILPQMCELVFEDGVVEISLCSKEADPPPRVLVDGYPLVPENGSRTLEHGSCVFLGYSHAFRLVVPPSDAALTSGASDLCILARESVEKLDMASAVCEIVDESGEQFKDILPYVNNLSSRAADSTVQDFISAIHRICPLIDEANMITKEMFGSEALTFQLHALTNVFNFANDFPEFVVCLLQNAEGTAKFKRGVKTVLHNLHQNRRHTDDSVTELMPHEAETHELLGKAHHPLVHEMGLGSHMHIGKSPLVYVWSLEKFLWRLNAIRDFYHDGCEAKDQFRSVRKLLADHPFMSPWREVALSEGLLIQAAGTMASHSHSSSPSKCDSVENLSDNEAADTVSQSISKSPGSSTRGPSSSAPKPRKKGKYVDSGDESSSSTPQSHGCSSTMCAAFESSVVASVDDSIDSALHQQTEWNRALGQKVESMSADIAQLRDTLLSPRDQLPPGPGMLHEGSKDVTSWLSQVDILRDTLTTLRDCTEEVERLALKKRDVEPHDEAMANKVIQQVQSLRSDVANIVKEELKDHLHNLKTNPSPSSPGLSGHTSPEQPRKFEAVVYTPRVSSEMVGTRVGRSISRAESTHSRVGLQQSMVCNQNPISMQQQTYPTTTPNSSYVASPLRTSVQSSFTGHFLPASRGSYAKSSTRSTVPSPLTSAVPSTCPSNRFPSFAPSLQSVRSLPGFPGVGSVSVSTAAQTRSASLSVSPGPSGRFPSLQSVSSLAGLPRCASGCSIASTAAQAPAAPTRKSSQSPHRRVLCVPKVTWSYYELQEPGSA